MTVMDLRKRMLVWGPAYYAVSAKTRWSWSVGLWEHNSRCSYRWKCPRSEPCLVAWGVSSDPSLTRSFVGSGISPDEGSSPRITPGLS